MKTFLDIVVEDLLQKSSGDLAGYTVVFPNKRASLFFNKSLSEHAERPVWSPRYTTISELLCSHSALLTGDRIRLVVELYATYKAVTESSETLDQFYSWGELMLADFDDIDKHMADADKVLRLIGDIHELDSTEYLNDTQREVLRRFFSNFTDSHDSQLKQRFLMLWSKFGEIYRTYRERLRNLGIGYEGMVYRDAIENIRSGENAAATAPAGIVGSKDVFVFVGFNLLNEVEQTLLDYLKGEGRALFYWDYDDYYMHGHEAGKYIAGHLKAYPNELPPDHEAFSMFDRKQKREMGTSARADVTFLAAPTEDLQARYISQWLTPERIKAGRRTAIVMCDESLLPTVLYCLPKEVSHINITTGFPLAQSHIASFVRIYMALLQKKSITLHSVNALLRHPYSRILSEKSEELMERLNEEVVYYPSLEELSADEVLTRLFAPLTNREDFCEINQRLLWAVKTIATHGSVKDGEAEGLYRMFTLLNRLGTVLKEMEVVKNAAHAVEAGGVALYQRLLLQIVQQTTIPFHGEPIEGIQIMGVLETRNLDFDHVLLLSCNEGNMPAKVSDSSFIPHSIRKAYGLTTIENKVAIYAYYFHRLLQRCGDVTVTYNNSTLNGKTGEMSRFMLQLLAESNILIERGVMMTGQEAALTAIENVEKTPEMVRSLIERGSLSPSGLGKYLRCQKSFYYCYVLGIKEDETSDAEEMDSKTFGNIFHKAAELLYKNLKGRTVTPQYLKDLLQEKHCVTLQRIVDQAFREELFKIKDAKKVLPRLGGMQVINREMVMKFLKELLAYDMKTAPFTLIDVEQWTEEIVEVNTIDGRKPFRIGGIIDRLDRVESSGEAYTRVLDYKTGKYTPLKMNSIEAIFDPSNVKNHSGYYLQAMLYSCIKSKSHERVIPVLLYVNQLFHEDYSPLLPLDGKDITDIVPLREEFMSRVQRLIEEILDPDIPFVAMPEERKCKYCPYVQLCKMK